MPILGNNASIADGVFGDDWFGLQADFNASGSDATSTLASQATAGDTVISLVVGGGAIYADGKNIVGQGICIVGAGLAGIDGLTTVVGVSGDNITLADAIVTTVAAGAVVMHDDGLAIQNALSSATASNIYTELGIYKVANRRLDFTKARKNFGNPMATNNNIQYPFAPYLNYEKTTATFISRDATKDFFYIGSSVCTLMGVGIVQDPAIERTAGNFVRVGPPDDSFSFYEGWTSSGFATDMKHAVDFVTVKNVSMLDPWVGIRLDHAWSVKVDDCFTWQFRKNGMHLKMDLPYGGSNFNRNWMCGIGGTGGAELGPNVGAGYLIETSDINHWNDNHSYLTLHGMELGATQYAIAGQMVTNHMADNLRGGYGLYIHNNGYFVHPCYFLGFHANNNKASVLGTYYIGVGCDGHTLVCVRGPNSAKPGIDNASGTTLIGCQ